MAEDLRFVAVREFARVTPRVTGVRLFFRGDVTFAARHATRPRALAAELGERAHAASAADAVASAEVVLVAVPALAVTGALQAAGPLDGKPAQENSAYIGGYGS